MRKTTANMYRLGWDERNGGNISYLLDENEVAEYIDLSKVIRTIPLAGVNEAEFDCSPLAGKIFIVTGTGKYFKNVDGDPENNLGIVRIAKDNKGVELLWGYKDGGRTTSELPAHLMCHMARLKVDPQNRVVMHSHPTHTLAMNYVRAGGQYHRICRQSDTQPPGRRGHFALDALRNEFDWRCNGEEDGRVQACCLGDARYLRRG